MADGAGGEASEDPRGDLLYPEEEAEKPPEEVGALMAFSLQY